MTLQTVLTAPFRSLLNNEHVWANFYRSETGYTIRFENLAEFKISCDGNAFKYFPLSEIEDDIRDHLLKQHVRPLMLSLQGEVIFHASSIKVENRAIAFAGESGMGKSTLAAFFAQNGHTFLSDDKLLAQNIDGHVLCHPSDPIINVWEESRQALFVEGDVPVTFNPVTSKYSAAISAVFPHQKTPLKLDTMFILKNNNSNRIIIEPLNGTEKFLALFYNSFQMDPLNQKAMTLAFEALAELTPYIQTYSLDYPRQFDQLNAVKEHIRYVVAEGNSLDL